MKASPAAKLHFLYATAICAAGSHAYRGFHNPPEVAVSLRVRNSSTTA